MSRRGGGVTALWGAVAALSLVELLFLATTKASLVFFGSAVGALGFFARAAVFVAACAARFPSAERGTIVLLASSCLSLAQFQFEGRRMSGDGVMYYVFVRSIALDRDVHLENEYAHYGLADRADLSMPTSTGHRRSAYPVGPAVLWLPFFSAGHALASAAGPALGMTDLSGYGPWHVNATALGSWLYGALALFLIRRLLRETFSDFVASSATLAIAWATFHEWYVAIQPLMSHAGSTFMAALAVFLWRRFSDRASPAAAAALGLVLGLSMCVRWQNGILGALPAATLIAQFAAGGDRRRTLKAAAAMAFCASLGVAPQLLTWKALFGSYLLDAPPQGTDYVRLDRPYVWNTFFSSRHGLFSWTPVFWAAFAGAAARAWRGAPSGRLFAAVIVAMTWVNCSVLDWWAGGSFSNRRFDSVLPLLAPGLATAIEWFLALRVSGAALVSFAALSAGLSWNLGLGASARAGDASPDAVVAAARGFTRTLGFPTTWPASWIFALEHRTTPDRYDRAQGRYLFFRQGNLNGRIDLGRDDGDDRALALDGFSEPVRDGRFTARRVEGRGRILAPLDEPEDLLVGVRSRTFDGREVALRVDVNGTPIGEIRTLPQWNTVDVFAPRARWFGGMNEVGLSSEGAVFVDIVTFNRPRRP